MDLESLLKQLIQYLNDLLGQLEQADENVFCSGSISASVVNARIVPGTSSTYDTTRIKLSSGVPVELHEGTELDDGFIWYHTQYGWIRSDLIGEVDSTCLDTISMVSVDTLPSDDDIGIIPGTLIVVANDLGVSETQLQEWASILGVVIFDGTWLASELQRAVEIISGLSDYGVSFDSAQYTPKSWTLAELESINEFITIAVNNSDLPIEMSFSPVNQSSFLQH